MKIPLTGRLCLLADIDDSDADAVLQYKWYALKNEHRIYVVRALPGRNAGVQYLHVFLLGKTDGFVIDHIDGDRLNNKRSNLRLVTISQNAANAKLSKRNKTGVKGVSITTNKYGKTYFACGVSFNGKTYKTAFAKFEDAVAWVTKKRNEVHGEFARHA